MLSRRLAVSRIDGCSSAEIDQCPGVRPAGDVEHHGVVGSVPEPVKTISAGGRREARDRGARPLDRLAGGLTEGVRRRRIAEGLAEPRQHGFAHPRIERRVAL
jgi:hypothetical protein